MLVEVDEARCIGCSKCADDCVADDLRAGSDEKLNELIKLLPRLMK